MIQRELSILSRGETVNEYRNPGWLYLLKNEIYMCFWLMFVFFNIDAVDVSKHLSNV